MLGAAPAAGAAPPPVFTRPRLITDLRRPPAGFRLTAAQVLQIAARAPKIRAERHRHPGLHAYAYTIGTRRWQVNWYEPGSHGRQLALAYVTDGAGRVVEAWTGFQIAWSMARGYPGAFARHAAAWYVWLPLCLLFVAPFLPRSRRPTLVALDIVVLALFSISLAFFNHAQIGLSVPLVYPCLLYLLVRMLALATGRGRPRTPLRPLVPTTWLVVVLLGLVAFRVTLNLTDSGVIDVGYSGVIGADRILHGHHLYGGWPSDDAQGDTYGPVNYLAYVPFRAVFGWSGHWDDLPAAHGAAVAFDLLTLLCLFLLGRRARGPDTGVLLAYAWSAYPFTLYVLDSNSNDSAVALLVVVALLLVGRPAARGAAGALAGLTKFAPLALAPLLARGTDPPPGRRALVAYAAGFTAALAAALAPVLSSGNWHAFWRDTVAFQAGRSSPFSIWGLWGGLSLEQHLMQGAAVGLALAVALLPRRRGLPEVAALGAAVLIAVQLGLTHWFYLYIPWFFPLVMVALVLSHPRHAGVATAVEPTETAAGSGPVVPAAART